VPEQPRVIFVGMRQEDCIGSRAVIKKSPDSRQKSKFPQFFPTLPSQVSGVQGLEIGIEQRHPHIQDDSGCTGFYLDTRSPDLVSSPMNDDSHFSNPICFSEILVVVPLRLDPEALSQQFGQPPVQFAGR